MTTLTFKVKDEEAQAIRCQAKDAGITLSEFLRRKALPTEPKKPRELVQCKHTGAMVFKGAPADIPLNNESVKEMLTDFP